MRERRGMSLRTVHETEAPMARRQGEHDRNLRLALVAVSQRTARGRVIASSGLPCARARTSRRHIPKLAQSPSLLQDPTWKTP